MADSDHDGAEDTDELLYSDLNDVGVCDAQPRRQDHCDLLLDAIDAQLGQLRVQSQKHQDTSRKRDCSNAAPLQMSKDTGLGSTSHTNDTPMSCLDLMHSPVVEQKSEWNTECWRGPDTRKENRKRSDGRTGNREDVESRREEVIWRLGRLLGGACTDTTVAGEARPLSDSVCTEDFAWRFREEMVEVTLPGNNTPPVDKEQAERTEVDDSDTRQSQQKVQGVDNAGRRGSATPGESSNDAVTARHSRLLDNFGVSYTGINEKGPVHDKSMRNKTDVLTDHENRQPNNSCSPKARFLAGVPVRSFDTVSIASDLDSVCTDQVRQHIHTHPGWRCLLQSVTGTGDSFTNQSDDDTTTQEESESQSPPVHRSCNVQKRVPFVRQAQHKKRETHRLVLSLSENDKDTDEEKSGWSRSEKRQCAKMKEQLDNLKHKCEREEETLGLKRAQLKDVELCLSELRQRRKHALQELEGLTAEMAQTEKEKQTTESILCDSRVERDSLSCQVETLQRRRESCLGEIREMEEELAVLRQRKNDGTCTERGSVIMSMLEREETERQLDSAKTELFAEQRRAREKLESMQETLEQTREELQRATEAESSLRSCCAGLEEKRIQEKEQTEALGVQVRGLHGELGECKIRVGTQERMLAQKELQLLDFQEKHGALQAMRDGLKGELRHLKSQHCKALAEAQEQACRMMRNQQVEGEKASALKEHALVLTRCIESMQSSIQLKEEEAKKLRISLEQQREEAKNREEELQKEASEKVQKTVEVARRKWEAEQLEAVQVQCGILEEQKRKSLESMRREMQQEKSKAQALQHKVSQLKTRIQELESESSAQQREQESLLAVICKSLKEEHQAELHRLKKRVTQDSERTVVLLEQAVRAAEKEAEGLRATLEERQSGYDQGTSQLERQRRLYGRELGAEIQQLRLLVEDRGASQSVVRLPASPTLEEAFTSLRALREQWAHSVDHLHLELDAQKRTIEQLRKDKERELSTQKQQLRMERDQAIGSLKERLIQEHIEELSSLHRAHVSGGGAEGGGLAASLRKQLKAKDLELRQVQASMGQWKERTAARLACKFEEELTAELERKTTGRTGEQRKDEQPIGGMTSCTKETLGSLCSPSLPVVDSAAPRGHSDVASFKLLRYLQSRVKQMRLENQAYACNQIQSLSVTQDQDRAGIQSNSAFRTASS